MRDVLAQLQAWFGEQQQSTDAPAARRRFTLGRSRIEPVEEVADTRPDTEQPPPEHKAVRIRLRGNGLVWRLEIKLRHQLWRPVSWCSVTHHPDFDYLAMTYKSEDTARAHAQIIRRFYDPETVEEL